MPIWTLNGGYLGPAGAFLATYLKGIQALDYTLVAPRRVEAGDPTLSVQYIGEAITSVNSADGFKLTGGRITAVKMFFNGDLLMSVTGLDLSAKALNAAANSKYPEAFARFMLSGRDYITGTSADDFLSGYAGADTLIGGIGKDALLGGSGGDELYGGVGNDAIAGGSLPTDTGNDLIFGGGGNDALQSFAGDDSIFGGDGNDYFLGRDGKDSLNGGGGNDDLSGNDGNDQVFGGGGDDKADLGTGNDAFYGGIGADTCFGRAGSDSIFGSEGNDRLDGLAGNDNLYGGVGNDILTGLQDDDLLAGGTGNDVLIGGDGSDRFVFDTVLGPLNVDQIVDFESNDDKILLDEDIFTELGSIGVLAAGKFRIGTNAADSSDRIIYNSTTGDLFYDKDGSGGAGQIKFANISVSLALDGSEFLITG